MHVFTYVRMYVWLVMRVCMHARSPRSRLGKNVQRREVKEVHSEAEPSSFLMSTPLRFLFGLHSVIIPQLLVDGVVVGDETTLQDLEEDGDLGKEKPVSPIHPPASSFPLFFPRSSWRNQRITRAGCMCHE